MDNTTIEDVQKRKEEIRSLIFQKIGYATMCWNPTPTGVFDSTECAKTGDEIMELVKQYAASLQCAEKDKRIDELRKEIENYKELALSLQEQNPKLRQRISELEADVLGLQNEIERDSTKAKKRISELEEGLRGLVKDVRNKPNDTRYATHLKIAEQLLK